MSWGIDLDSDVIGPWRTRSSMEARTQGRTDNVMLYIAFMKLCCATHPMAQEKKVRTANKILLNSNSWSGSISFFSFLLSFFFLSFLLSFNEIRLPLFLHARHGTQFLFMTRRENKIYAEQKKEEIAEINWIRPEPRQRKIRKNLCK